MLFQEKAVLYEALAVNAAKVIGPEYRKTT